MPERGMISHLERILYLKKLPIFSLLPNDSLAALAEMLRERAFPKDAVIQREGESVTRIQFILDGQIRASRRGVPMPGAGPGTPMGALAVLARDPQGYLGIADVDTFTLELESDALLEVCEDHFAIVHRALQYLSRWAISVQQRLGPEQRASAPPITRLASGELDFVERIFFLRQITPFARGSINALAELSRGLTEVHFDAGIPLWAEGDPAHYVLLIADGRVGCASQAHKLRFEAGPPYAVAAMEAVAEVRHWFSATTLTPVRALHGTIEGMLDVFEDNFELAMDYAALLAAGMLSYLERAGANESAPPDA